MKSQKESATSELTSSPPRDLHVSSNIEAIDIQLLEHADAAHGLTRQQENVCIELLLERGNKSGVDTLLATPPRIRALAQIVDLNRNASI